MPALKGKASKNGSAGITNTSWTDENDPNGTANSAILFVDKWSQNVQSIQVSLQQKNLPECLTQLESLVELIRRSQYETIKDKERSNPTSAISITSFQRVILIIREVITLDSLHMDLLVACHNTLEALCIVWRRTPIEIRSCDPSTTTPIVGLIDHILTTSMQKVHQLDDPLISSIPDAIAKAKLQFTKESQHLHLIEISLCCLYFRLHFNLQNKVDRGNGDHQVIQDLAKYVHEVHHQYPGLEPKLASSVYKCLYNIVNSLVSEIKAKQACNINQNGNICWVWMASSLRFIQLTPAFKMQYIGVYISAVLKKMGLIGTFLVQQNACDDVNTVTLFLQALRNTVDFFTTNYSHGEGNDQQIEVVLDSFYAVGLFLVAKLNNQELMICKDNCLLILILWKSLGKQYPQALLPLSSDLRGSPSVSSAIEKMTKLWNFFLINWSIVWRKKKSEVIWLAIHEQLKMADYKLCIWLQNLVWSDYSTRLALLKRSNDMGMKDEVLSLNDVFIRFWTIGVQSTTLSPTQDILQCFLELQQFNIFPSNGTIETLFERVENITAKFSINYRETVGTWLFLLHANTLMLRTAAFCKKRENVWNTIFDKLQATIIICQKLVSIDLNSFIGSTVLSAIALNFPTISQFCFLSGLMSKQMELSTILRSRLAAFSTEKQDQLLDSMLYNCLSHTLLGLHFYMGILNSWFNVDSFFSEYLDVMENLKTSQIGQFLYENIYEPIRQKMFGSNCDINPQLSEKLQSMQQLCVTVFGKAITEAYCFKGWIHLLHGKLIWIYCFDFKVAIKWVKLALSYSTSDGTASSHTPLEYQLPRLEGLLFTSDLYDHKGKLSKCLDYMAEAQNQLSSISPVVAVGYVDQSLASKSELHSCDIVWHHSLLSFLTSKYFLSSLRIWYRSDSRRLMQIVCNGIEGTITEYKNRKMVDESVPLFMVMVWELGQCFSQINKCWEGINNPMLEQVQFFNNSINKSKLQPTNAISQNNISTLMFGYMLRDWGLSFENVHPVSLKMNLKSPLGTTLFHSISFSNLKKLSCLDVVVNNRTFDICVDDIMKKYGGEYFEIASFDCQRWIRRRMCQLLTIMTSDGDCDAEFSIIRRNEDVLPSMIVNTDFRAFLFGASSCFHLLEYQEKHHNTTNCFDKTEMGSLIQLALSGCTQSQAEIRRSLGTLLNSVQQLNQHENHSTICFLAIEPETIGQKGRFLLIGTFDGLQKSKTLAIPISEAMEAVLSRWEYLQSMNQESLKPKDFGSGKLSESQKREWWKAREDIDHQLETYLKELQDMLLPALSAVLDELLSSSMEEPSCDDEMDEDDIDRLVANCKSSKSTSSSIAKRQEKSKKDNDITLALESLSLRDEALPKEIINYDTLKLVELRELLRKRNLSTIGKKSELMERLLENDRQFNNQVHNVVDVYDSDEDFPKKKQGSRDQSIKSLSCKKHWDAMNKKHHTIFILDESLQSIPIESIPVFRNKSCSRYPSLALALEAAHGLNKNHNVEEHSTLRIQNCWYAIDIENNLSNTRQTMETFLNPYQAKYDWTSCIGKIPDEDFVREVHGNSDLFIFCGHGAGDKIPLFPKQQVSSTTRNKTPSAMLWGCSSGKLSSRGLFDPVGAPIHHLRNGAQFVVGNLWDVTDKDLDKLSIDCMTKSFESDCNKKDSKSISEALAIARNVCKMKFAVGSAAVLYGAPLHCTLQK